MTVLNGNTARTVNLVTTAETAAVTVTPPPVSEMPQVGFSPKKIVVRGVINVTAGAGTTAVQIRVKGGSGTGGAQLQGATPDTHTLAAGASASIPFSEVDEGAQFSSASTFTYTVTVQQVGATGNGTVNYAYIEAAAMIEGV